MSISKDKFKIPGPPPKESTRGSSSIAGTQILRSQLPDLFCKYNITSMFDAGSNDGVWAQIFCSFVNYSGGDINPHIVEFANNNYPNLQISEFDMLTDNFPLVDLIFVRDVSIHFTNAEKKLLLANFIKSQVPWLMITQQPEVKINHDISVDHHIITAKTNWCVAPWLFPEPTDSAYEYSASGRCMGLWHRDQLKASTWQ